jgi:hypothetical protein
MTTIALSGNAGGAGGFTIAAPSTASTRTLTLPDVNGTLVSTGDTGTVSSTMLASASVTQAKLDSLVLPIGVDQTWQVVTRAEATTYTNTTGRTIIAYISVATTNAAGTTGVVNGVTVHSTTTNVTGTMRIPIVLTVPPGGTYSATWSSLVSWVELR